MISQKTYTDENTIPTKTLYQALVEKGVDGKDSGSNDKYESHTDIGDLTIIFADTRLIIIKRKEASCKGGGVALIPQFV